MEEVTEPKPMPDPERGLLLLCEALLAKTESESNRRNRIYYEFLQPLMFKSALVAYRLNDDLAETAVADLFGDHSIQLLNRGVYADGFDAQLALVQPVGEDDLLRQRFVQWQSATVKLVSVAKELHTRHAAISAVELRKEAEASNAAIKDACEAGARLLSRFVSGQGATLRCWKKHCPVEGADLAEDGEQAAANLFPALDRMIGRLVTTAPDDASLRAGLAERLTVTGGGAAAIFEFVLQLAIALRQLARIRLPMLGLLYRQLKTRAIDFWNAHARYDPLDANEDTSRDDEGTVRRFGSLATQSTSGELEFEYFDNGDAASLLEAIEEELRRPEDEAMRAAAAEKHPKRHAPLNEKARMAKAVCDFRVSVAQLRLEGYAQEDIADLLAESRDRVRTALRYFEAAIISIFGRRKEDRSKSKLQNAKAPTHPPHGLKPPAPDDDMDTTGVLA